MSVLLILSSLTLLSGCDDKGEQAEQTTQKPQLVIDVHIQHVKPVVMTDVLTLPGETEAMNDVSLAAERAGVVEWAGVNEGDTVTAGQELMRIDLSALKAALDRAKANAVLAKDQLARRSNLFKRRVLSREELEKAENERTVANATLREAEVNVTHGVVNSPVNGRVNKRYVDPGEYVKEGDAVFDIVDVSRLKVNVNVPELDVRYLKKGQPVVITADAYPKRTWHGIIGFVAWKADETTRTFRVKVYVDNEDGAIRPGMIVRASFVRQHVEDALAVPLFAIMDKGGERILFVEEDGVAKARTVEFGIISKDLVQINKGLSAGDRLIVAGQRQVEDGTRVNVRKTVAPIVPVSFSATEKQQQKVPASEKNSAFTGQAYSRQESVPTSPASANGSDDPGRTTKAGE